MLNACVTLLLIFQDSHLFGSHRQQWMKAPRNKLNERVMNLKQPPSYKHNTNHRIHCKHHQAHSYNKFAWCDTFMWQHNMFEELKAGLTCCSWRGKRAPFSLCGFPITVTNWNWRKLKNSIHHIRATCASTHWLLPGAAHREGFQRSLNLETHSDSKNKQREGFKKSHIMPLLCYSSNNCMSAGLLK